MPLRLLCLLLAALVVCGCGGSSFLSTGVKPGGGDTTLPPNPGGDNPPSAPRTITVSNECSFPVWIGAVGGYTKGATCTVDADCGAGRKCVDKACSCRNDNQCGTGRACNPDNNSCYWVLPTPNPGKWKLDAKVTGKPASSATFTLPEVDYINGDAHIRWSGGIFPRTGCALNPANKFVCETGSCGDREVCEAGHGGTPPATQAEFTFQNYAIDFYDMEIINGATVPMEMKPVTPSDGYGKMEGSASYWCGNPGGDPALTPSLEGCGWQFPTHATMTPVYRYVTASATECTSDADCAAAERCGLSIAAVAPQPLGPNLPSYWGKLTCGRPLGYWSPIGICGLNPHFGPQPMPGLPSTNLYDCNLPVDPQFGTYRTLTDLYGCVVPNPNKKLAKLLDSAVILPNDVQPPGATPPPCGKDDLTCPAESCYSCYKNPDFPNDPSKCIPASDTCCGCAAWPWPTNDTDCRNDNPAFEMYYFPKIEFLKTACPTAYTYQYDDETSTFHCVSKYEKSKGQGNALSYQVTFCPGGREGGVGH